MTCTQNWEILVFYLWRDSGVLICQEILVLSVEILVFYLWRFLVLVFYLWRDSDVLSVERFWCSVCDIKHFGDVKLKCRKKVHEKSVGDAENIYNQYQIKAAFNHHFCCCGSWSFHLFQALNSYFWFEYERASYVNTTYLQTFLLVECKIHSSPKSTPIFRPLFSWLSG